MPWRAALTHRVVLHLDRFPSSRPGAPTSSYTQPLALRSPPDNGMTYASFSPRREFLTSFAARRGLSLLPGAPISPERHARQQTYTAPHLPPLLVRPLHLPHSCSSCLVGGEIPESLVALAARKGHPVSFVDNPNLRRAETLALSYMCDIRPSPESRRLTYIQVDVGSVYVPRTSWPPLGIVGIT